MSSSLASPRSLRAWANFRQRVAELGGEVLEPVYLGALKSHRCRCAEGHECRPRPNDVQQGKHPCRTCAYRNRVEMTRRKIAGRDNFYRSITELGGRVLEPEYLGSQRPHRCLCAKGHECSPRPADIQRGAGMCRVCCQFEQDALYVVRNQAAGCVKFGITSSDGSRRLREHSYDGFTEVVLLETGLTEFLAAVVERKVKTALNLSGAEAVRGEEYFSDDCIELILNEIGIWIL